MKRIGWMGRALVALMTGIALHFVMVTRGQHIWGDLGLLRLRKEVALIVGLVFVIPHLRSICQWNKLLWVGLALLLMAMARSLWVSFGLRDTSLYTYVYAYKYDFFFFVALLVGIVVVPKIQHFQYFINIIHYVCAGLLGLGVIRYILIGFFPDVIASLGYSQDVRGRVAGGVPPIRYLTDIWWGYVRNQGVFGGPVSRGFFLIAMGPWFLLSSSHKKPIQTTFVVLWVVNVVLSLSRAAWGISIIAIVCMLIRCIKYRKSYIISLISGLVIGLPIASLLIWSVGSKEIDNPWNITGGKRVGILSRTSSDKGHFILLMKGLQIVGKNPLIGQGAGTAGPASYTGHKEDKNSLVPKAYKHLQANNSIATGDINKTTMNASITRKEFAILLRKFIAANTHQYCSNISYGNAVEKKVIKIACGEGGAIDNENKIITFREALIVLGYIMSSDKNMTPTESLRYVIKKGLYAKSHHDLGQMLVAQKHAVLWLRMTDSVMNNEPIEYNPNDFGQAGRGFNPENNYIQIAIEYGVVGLLLWLGVCICVMIGLWNIWQKSQYKNADVFGLLLGLGGLAGVAMVLHPFADSQVMYITMLLVGIYLGKQYS